MREWVRFVKDMSENELEKIEHYFDGARRQVSFFRRPVDKKTVQAIAGWQPKEGMQLHSPITF